MICNQLLTSFRGYYHKPKASCLDNITFRRKINNEKSIEHFNVFGYFAQLFSVQLYAAQIEAVEDNHIETEQNNGAGSLQISESAPFRSFSIINVMHDYGAHLSAVFVVGGGQDHSVL